MAAPLATLTGMKALENLMDSEAGIVEVVLGTEFLTTAHLATLTGINALEMDSEGGIVEVVLGTKFLTIAHLATLTGINAVEMDSEGSIVEDVLGTEFQTMTDEQAIIKLGLKTGAGSSHGKSVQATIRFVIHPVIFFIPFMTL